MSELSNPPIDHENPSRLICAEESWTRCPRVDLLGVLVFAGFMAIWGLEGGPPLSDHEAIVAQAARQMRQGDGWLIPHVGEDPFVRKPPLAFWLAAIASYLIEDPRLDPPVSEFAARLPSAVAAILTTLVVYLLGRAMFGHRTAVMTALVNASCAGTLYFSHNAQAEMVLTFLMTVSMASFWFATHEAAPARRTAWWVAFYVALALAMLTKAPQPVGAVVLPLAVWWFVIIPLFKLDASTVSFETEASRLTRAWEQIRGLRSLWIMPGTIVFLLLFLPWPIYVYSTIHQVTNLWEIEFIGRYSGDMGREGTWFAYYLPVLAGLVIPFTLSLPEAVATPLLAAFRRHRAALLFLLTWVVVQVIFFSFSAFKRPRYILGAVPGLAILLGLVVDLLFLSARSFSLRALRAVVIGIIVVAAVGFVIGGYYVRTRYPDAFWLYTRGSVLCATGIVVVCLCFLKGKRLLSLCALLATTAAVFGWCWFGLGQGVTDQSMAREMAESLRRTSIAPEDPLTWLRGRPDAALMYYLERPINPMFTDLEMASMRGDRLDIPPELVEKIVSNLIARLSSDRKEYFILRGSDWAMIKAFYSAQGYELLRIRSNEKPGPDDWVVITNAWNSQK